MKNNIFKKCSGVFKKFSDDLKNPKYNFAKNFWYHMICPLVIIVLGAILALCINFNLGIDFKGGTVATVVIEQDLSDAKVYKDTKAEVEKVLKNNKVDSLVYQTVETNYYGNAISVKFNGVSDELRETIKNDLVQAFHSEATESDKEIFVKVDNFKGTVDNGVMLSTALGILIAIICVTVYLWIRFGVSAGFITLIMALLDNALLLTLLAIVRVRLEIGTMAAFGFVTIYSVIMSTLYFSRMNDNLKQEKFAKSTKLELANEALKNNLVLVFFITCLLLLITFVLDAVPVYMLSSSALPLMFAVIIPYATSLYITPGLWARTYVKRKLKKADKDDKKVVVEEKLSEEDLTNAPEVIVETEAKEEN